MTVSAEPDRAPRILFVSLSNDVGMERVPAALGALGAACAVLSPPGFYCTSTRFATRHFALPRHRGMWLGTPFVRVRLEAAIRAWEPDLVVPLDDIPALLLRMLARSPLATDRLRALLETSFGSPDGYPTVCSRAGLLRAAAGLGVRIPPYCVADDDATVFREADRWGYPVVLKAEYTCGGHGVCIASDPGQLRAALATTAGGATAWNRWRTAARHRMWSLAGLTGTAGLPPVLQAFVPGVPAMRTVSAWRGQVLEGVSFVAERVHPTPTGSSTVVRYIEHDEMAVSVRRLVAALGCSGFVSFDFMLDAEHGRAHLIEMNPRPIGTAHLGRMFGHDPYAALLARLRNEPPISVQASIAPDRAIALFPKEMERDPENLDRLRAADILHDVPHDDPATVAVYLRRLSRVHPGSATAIAHAVGPSTPQAVARLPEAGKGRRHLRLASRALRSAAPDLTRTRTG